MASASVLNKGETLNRLPVPVMEDELQSPQRSITDFFKSPPSKKKSKNLSDVFSSTPKEKCVNAQPSLFSTSKKKTISLCEEIGSPIVETKKKRFVKEDKDKKILVENGDSTNMEDKANKSGISRRVKTKKKKKTKKVNDSLDDQFIQHFDSIHVKSDTSTDDINILINSTSSITKSVNNQNSSKTADLLKEQVCKTSLKSTKHEAKDVLKDSEQNSQDKFCSETKNNLKAKMKKLDRNSSENSSAHPPAVKSKRKRSTDGDIAETQNKKSKLTTKSSKDQTNSFASSKEISPVKEKESKSVSYEDYLKDLPVDSTTTDIFDAECVPNDDDNTELLVPDNYPSVEQYFGKSPVSTENMAANNSLTITVDVHQEPASKEGVFDLFRKGSNKKKTRDKTDNPIILSPNSSYISVDDDEIVFISSEIQEVEVDQSKPRSKISKADVQITESPKPKPLQISKESEDFLKSNEKTVAPTKTAQATLCFTKKGLKTDVKNIVKEPLPPMPDIDAIPAEHVEKSQKLSKKKSKKTDADIKDSRDLAEKNQQQKKTKKIFSVDKELEKNEKRKKTKKSQVNDVIVEQTDISDRLCLNEMNNNDYTPKKKKKKYKVTSLQFDDSKRTPIKMKIKCRKSLGGGNSSLEESEFTPKSNKHSSKKDSAKKLLVKAQEILVKAKKQKTKKTKEKKVAKTPKRNQLVNRRSSPRLASKPCISLEEVIDIDDDVDDDDDDIRIVEEKVKKTKTKSRKVNAITDTPTKSTKLNVSTPVKSTKAKSGTGTPVKSTKAKIGTPVKTGTPKKGTGKVASIFNVKKKQDKNEPEIVKPPEDPEKVKQRQAFLSSGIPDVVKKQKESSASQVIALPEYPPFPKDSHIQQLSSNYNQTTTNLSIKLLKLPRYTGCNITWSQLQLTNLYKPTTSANNSLMDFKHHESLSSEICMKLLEEIKVTNPVYPAQLMYDSLNTKRLDDLNSLKPEDTAEISSKPEEPVVITLDEENDVVKVKKKSKLKRKKERKKSVEEIKAPEPKKRLIHASSELLWTDKYQPSHSSDIIGNTSDINKLKTWLLEWKHKTHKDARKMKKLLSKQSKSLKSSNQDSQWYKDDSDFDSDESEEDDRLCNTMLITGQHGIGKTATVYALAQELGYKVFEVNTSSSRNGKKILARLQEATQSHQVAQNKDGIAPPVFGATDSPLTPKKDIKNKLPTAFNNLFSKAKKVEQTASGDVSKNNKTEKSNTSNKKRKREVEAESESPAEIKPKKKKKESMVDDHLERMSQLYHKEDSNQAGGLNLTSTSVILFDEVDLVFDKDHGFISAIQYFMSTTKIPIILTTTNKNVANLIQARLEIIQFYPPTQRLIASHLQTICLVEGIRCQYKDLLYLVRYYNNDVRRCILAVQFWLESGASPLHHQHQQKLKPLNSITGHHIDSDEDDFVQSKPRSNRRILDDEESNSSTVDNDTPLIHSLCFESVLGLTNKLQSCIDTHVSSFLQENFNAYKLNSTLYCCELLRTLRFNLLHHNILHLVPLPQTCLTKYKPTPVISTVIKHSCILDSEDYDSETSNSKAVETVEKQSPTKSNESKKEKRYISKCLSSFSTYYDNMCLLDNLQTSFNLKDLDNPVHTTRIKDIREPSLIDVQTTYQNSNSWLHDSHTDIMNHIEARSSQMLCEEIQDIYLDIEKKNSNHDESFLDKLSLPVENGATRFHVSHKHRKHEKSISEAHDNIISTLPPSSSSRCVSLDYIPYLRTIHQTECLKKKEKAKRRFHHHFDNIGFGLKRSTLSYLDKTLD